MAKIRIKNIGRLVAWLMRGIGMTLRWEIRDDAGVFDAKRRGWIWSFWHNRMFLIPWLHHEWFAHVPGTILTSPSGDGQIIADVCESFGIEAERGSSSKPEKGMSALIALAKKSNEGYEIGITPDGPRAPVIPVHLHYSHAIKFKTWDEFLLPLPFAKITLVFDKPHHVPRRMTEEEFEQQRAALEEVMRFGTSLENLHRSR